MIHTFKGFGAVNKEEVDVFLEFSCSFYNPMMLTIWFLIPLPFLNTNWTFGTSRFMYYWSLAWRILSITLLACERVQLCGSLSILWHCLFFGIGMKTDLFQSCGHCWVFQICWHIEYRTLIASSFRIWNSSTGTPSPPLPFFVVMLPKAHLTSHSRVWFEVGDHIIMVIWVMKIFFV